MSRRLKPDDVKAKIRWSERVPKIRKYADGNSLYLAVRNGFGWWIYQWREGKSFRSKSLGSASDLSPAAARNKREAMATARRAGRIDRRGIRHRRALADQSTAPSTSLADESLDALLLRFLMEAGPTWKSGRPLAGLPANEIEDLIRTGHGGKEVLSYTRMFDRLPDFLSQPAQLIDPLNFRRAVEKQWPDAPPTINRMVKRLGTLLKFQKEGLRNKAEKRNHAMMAYTEVPTFLRDLSQRLNVGARALRWTILTAARTTETLQATWGEISKIDGKPVWVIPGERMKTGKRHVVPLTKAMLALLGEREADDAPLFRGGEGGFPHHTVMYGMLQRYKAGLTVHGFRATFRTWAADCTDFPREIAEVALAHTVGGVEGAYNRGELLEKRRKLMDAWSRFCEGADGRNAAPPQRPDVADRGVIEEAPAS